MRLGIVMQKQNPLVWHLRPYAWNSFLMFTEIGLINSRIDCFIRRRKVQQKHNMHVPKHRRHQLLRAGWFGEFFNGGKLCLFPCHGLRNCLMAVLVHPRFIASNDLLQDILTINIKTEEVSEGCTHTVFLVVLCQLSRDLPAAHFSVL